MQTAISAISAATRDTAYQHYLTDPRDTTTPRGMANLLYAFNQRELLSSASTGYILNALRACQTFPNRLKAGLRDGWSIAHKTGTSSTHNGMTAATNDVGILTSPTGKQIIIVVFIADSAASDRDRAALTAKLSRATIDYYSR